ncbi:MAG: hypothetical protein V3U80_11180, partial [Flavobacteriaceae bacterium]
MRMILKRLILIAFIYFFSQNSFSQEKRDYFIKNININTDKINYGAAFYGGNILFYSSLNENNNLDFYFGFVDDYGDVIDSKPVNTNINGKLNEVDLVFTSDLKRVYFTRGSGKYGRHLELYTANVESPENWTNIKRLPFNRQNRSIGYPALSDDDKTLYFSSNRTGSLGGYDIFKVTVLGKNKYSEAINLGPEVNTPKFETSPFVSGNILYYSSERDGGIGGYDIYYFDMKAKNAVPINLGNSMNSNKDDYGFVIKRSENVGYIASDRDQGKGSKDIYSFQNFIRPTTPGVEEVIVVNEDDFTSIDTEMIAQVGINKVEPIVKEVAPVVVETTPVVVETVEPIVVEEVAPVVVETTEPVIVYETTPVVVETIEPIVIEEVIPVVVETTEPVIVYETTPVVVETIEPIVVEEVAPVVVETTEPVIVYETTPVVVETI